MSRPGLHTLSEADAHQEALRAMAHLPPETIARLLVGAMGSKAVDVAACTIREAGVAGGKRLERLLGEDGVDVTSMGGALLRSLFDPRSHRG